MNSSVSQGNTSFNSLQSKFITGVFTKILINVARSGPLVLGFTILVMSMALLMYCSRSLIFVSMISTWNRRQSSCSNNINRAVVVAQEKLSLQDMGSNLLPPILFGLSTIRFVFGETRRSGRIRY